MTTAEGPSEAADVHQWLETGIAAGYCSEVTCATHDGLPQTEEEMAAEEEGGDPCIPAVRLWYPGEAPQ